MEAGDSRQEENMNVGPIHDSWIAAIGCMNDIEEEESIDDYSKTISATEKNIAGVDEALVTPLALGTIDNTYLDGIHG